MGETFEVTDHGRVVALLVGTSSQGIAALIEQGKVRAADGDLLEIEPVLIPSAACPHSALVVEGRGQ
ncbi:MAG: hypothetical protein HY678_10135 [Chloroflexi bacterium]|nr:hypothetical protein [Chloroflexota bacterium]